jgi:hypothetical protein
MKVQYEDAVGNWRRKDVQQKVREDASKLITKEKQSPN